MDTGIKRQEAGKRESKEHESLETERERLPT
jgi:hypothetical protein